VLLKQAPDYLAVASRINRIDVWQAAAQAVGGISAPDLMPPYVE
jgi:nitrate/nitrite transport system substrate-binding protein